MNGYFEVPPPPELADDVVCLWAHIVDEDAPFSKRVLPDACADVVWFDHRPPVVAGAATRAQIICTPAQATMLGVRFHPGAVSRWLSAPAFVARDRHIELAEFEDASVPRVDPRRLHREPASELLDALAEELCEGATSWRRLEPEVREIVRWSADQPDGRIDDLARHLSLSTRQLHRVSTSAIGYGAKLVQRILRVQRALSIANREDNPSLAAVAVEAGYADQAHMTREVRELAGTVPGRLFGRATSAFALTRLFATGPGSCF